MACSASEKSFLHGPCSKWPARREHSPTEGPDGLLTVDKREELPTRTVFEVASGKRPVGNGGFSLFSLEGFTLYGRGLFFEYSRDFVPIVVG